MTERAIHSAKAWRRALRHPNRLIDLMPLLPGIGATHWVLTLQDPLLTVIALGLQAAFILAAMSWFVSALRRDEQRFQRDPEV